MKYDEINDRDILLKEYDFQNKMLENKNIVFNRITFFIVGIVSVSIPYFKNQLSSMSNNTLYIGILLLMFIILVISDFISQRIIKKDKTEIYKKLKTLSKEKNNESLMKNHSIQKLLDCSIINHDEFELLFEDKDNDKWNNSDNIEKFWKIFEKVKKKLSKNHIFDFSYIHFPKTLDNDIFDDIENFSNCTFYEKVSFKEATFEDEVKFSGSTFKKNADFSEVNFEGDTYFDNCTFLEGVTFENSECKGSIDFSGIKFKNIKLDKADFPKASYLNLKGLSNDNQEEKLEKKHFKTRESARVIKAHLETQKNILEANKYFVIEQNMHYDSIIEKKVNYYKKFVSIAPLFLDKYVSNFGTSWARVLMWIVGFTLIVYTFHSYDLAFQFDMVGFGNILNDMVKYINPVSVLKNKNYYDGNEFWGMVVRVITIYLFWQFAKSFRSQTKRN